MKSQSIKFIYFAKNLNCSEFPNCVIIYSRSAINIFKVFRQSKKKDKQTKTKKNRISLITSTPGRFPTQPRENIVVIGVHTGRVTHFFLFKGRKYLNTEFSLKDMDFLSVFTGFKARVTFDRIELPFNWYNFFPHTITR